MTPQNYFPLEVGNRWDYFISGYSHGGNYWYDTLSVEVIGKISFNTNKDYYILSESFFGGEYLCIKNDSLYFYDTDDSLDCLMFAFNQNDSSYYSSCMFDSCRVNTDIIGTHFGITDTIQRHLHYFWGLYEYSRLFGLVYWNWGSLLQVWEYSLSGCIISGVTYGNLLVSIDMGNAPVNEFMLFQNYPNLFNPTSTIKYQIPELSFVTLKVYDVLGNEIATLVNAEMPAGEYVVEFDGSGLTSGIYFYQLRAGNFFETRKMILMK